MSSTILITRPEPAASHFAEELRLRFGDKVEIVCAPLIRIEWVDPSLDLSTNPCLIFTSSNGVEGFARVSERREFRCYTVGDATAEAARRIGLDPISAGGDAEALVAKVRSANEPGPCLHLRGDHVAKNIAGALRSSGTETDETIVYRQVATGLTTQARDVLQREYPVIVPLFSPRTARQFAKEYSGGAPVFIAAISEAVAQEVGGLEARLVMVASEPNAKSMTAAIEGLLDAANHLEGRQGPQ